MGPMQNPQTTTNSLLQMIDKVIAARDDGRDPKDYPGLFNIGIDGGGGSGGGGGISRGGEGGGGGTVFIDVKEGGGVVGRVLMKAHSFLDEVLVRDTFTTGRLCFDIGEILQCAPDQVFGQGTVLARTTVFAPD